MSYCSMGDFEGDTDLHYLDNTRCEGNFKCTCCGEIFRNESYECFTYSSIPEEYIDDSGNFSNDTYEEYSGCHLADVVEVQYTKMYRCMHCKSLSEAFEYPLVGEQTRDDIYTQAVNCYDSIPLSMLDKLTTEAREWLLEILDRQIEEE